MTGVQTCALPISVRFDQMDMPFSVLVKAGHALEAASRAAEEAHEFAALVAAELMGNGHMDATEDLVRLMVVEDEDNPPVVRLSHLTDAEANSRTLRSRAQQVQPLVVSRAQDGQHPSLFHEVQDVHDVTRAHTAEFLEGWLQEVG